MAIANLKTCQTQIGIEGRKYQKKISTANLKVITCNPNLLITYYLNLSQNYFRKCVFSSVTYQIRKLKWSGFFTKTSSKICSFLYSFNSFLLYLHKFKFWNPKICLTRTNKIANQSKLQTLVFKDIVFIKKNSVFRFRYLKLGLNAQFILLKSNEIFIETEWSHRYMIYKIMRFTIKWTHILHILNKCLNSYDLMAHVIISDYGLAFSFSFFFNFSQNYWTIFTNDM